MAQPMRAPVAEPRLLAKKDAAISISLALHGAGDTIVRLKNDD
jgi:hypothetical protein